MTNPFITSNRVRAALRGLDLHPTRGMGQNFLIDPAVLEQIVAAGEIRREDTVVEVGPGLGVLTWELVQRADRIIAVELDRRLAARLEEEFSGESRLQIIQSDILDVPPEQILGIQSVGDETRDSETSTTNSTLNTQQYKVIANLPYAITSPVLRHFLEASWQPELLVVLVQWEVAQRIAARQGDLSMLAHAIQFYAEPEVVAQVLATSFTPVPAVSSAILRLRVRAQPPVDVDDVDAFFRVIKASFLQPRKKLSNALPGGLAAMGQRIERAAALAVLEDAGVSPERRAETVTLEEWAKVYRRLKDEV